MSAAGDFSQLYRELGITADCSLPDFKQACRRRIRAQHPDRTCLDELSAVQPLPLDELLPLYARALRFHRRHGRLPGAALPGGRATPAGFPRPAAAGPTAPWAAALAAPAAVAPPAGLSLRGPFLAVAGIAVALLLAGMLDDHVALEAGPPREAAIDATMTAAVATAAVAPGAAAADETDGPPAARLELGMDSDTVLAIQGAPMRREGAEWLYGPSWIRFEHGQVVGWYSSPLHRLKTSSDTPPETDSAAVAATGGS